MNAVAKKKADLLGMNFSTASHRLRQQIMFSLIVETGKDLCFRCGLRILSADQCSIEHKVAWISSGDPVRMFFSPDNLAFSHKSCNYGAAEKPYRYATKEEKIAAKRKSNAASMRKIYTPEKRRQKKILTGH